MTVAGSGAHEIARPPVALIFAITVTGILNNTMLTPALPDILSDLGVGNDRAGMLVASGTLPGIVMAPVIGLMADRFGRRRVLVPCLVGFAVFGGLAALAPTFPALVAARLLQGIGSAGLINLAVVIISDHWEGVERTALVGRNSAVLTLSLATFPPLGGLLTDLGGWRWSFQPYWLGLITAWLVWRRLPDHRPGGGGTVLAQLRGAGAVARNPVVLATVVAGFMIFVLVFGLFLTTMPVHLEEDFGLGASVRGLVIAVPAIPSTIMALNLARARSRLGIRRLLVLASMLFVAAFAVIGSADVLPLLFVGAALYGIGEGVFIPSLQDVAASASPPEHRGAIVAVWVGAARAGQTVGPLAASAVFAATSTSATFVFGAALAGVLGLSLLVGPIREARLGVVPRPAPAR